MHERIMNEVMLPTVHGLASEGMHYRGFLYAGLMISPDGDPKVLEFNCRLGDPEAQPILFRLRSDLVDHCQAALQGTLGSQAIEWDPRAAVGVVMASRGYPGDYRKGKTIRGLPAAPDQEFKVFHAGTIVEGEHVVTSGGRVLCAVGLGNDVREARSRVYEGIKGIEWDGGFFRNDIGYRAVVREETSA
jgi:phosphoribosylamine--glycine ligase